MRCTMLQTPSPEPASAAREAASLAGAASSTAVVSPTIVTLASNGSSYQAIHTLPSASPHPQSLHVPLATVPLCQPLASVGPSKGTRGAQSCSHLLSLNTVCSARSAENSGSRRPKFRIPLSIHSLQATAATGNVPGSGEHGQLLL
jgi:hypothetical protein